MAVMADTKPKKGLIAHGIAAQNRKARFDYTIKGTVEAGLVLKGPEVQSLRLGRATLSEAWAGASEGVRSFRTGDGRRPMKRPQTGGCHCGAIRYEITEAPALVYTCHCTDCQRLTGSAFSMAFLAAAETFFLTGAAPRAFRHRAD